MIVSIKECGNGVNKDLLPSELLPGQWSDCSNMRFRNKFAEKFRGIQAAYTTPVVAPYWLEAYNSSTSRFLIEGGLARVFVDDGTTQTEITRAGDGVAIASITFVTTTATLTTTAAHGRTTGDTVIVYAALPTGYNGAFVITVTSPTAFTYTMTGTPASNATFVGAYSTNAASNFTGARDDRWTGGVLNGVLLMNNPVNGLYYWGGDTATKLRKMPAYSNIADAARPFKNFIVFLGSTVSSVKMPHNVAWSKSAEPGTIPTEYTSTASNDAGNVDLAETPGHMVDCLPLGDVNIIYKQDARYAMQYIGGNDVFRFVRLPGNDGLLARSCVVNTPKGHVFLSNGDVKIHSGGEAVSIADGRIRQWLFRMMDSTNAQRSFLCLNPQKTEVWVVFPSFAQTDCDTVAAWNWDTDTWGIRSVSSVTCAANGLIPATLSAETWASDTDPWNTDATTWLENEYSANESRLILGTSTPKIGLAETGTMDFGVVFSWMLEKRGIHLDDPESVKVLSASRPQIDAIDGTAISISHGSAMTANGEPTYASPSTHTTGTSNWANAFARGGRYMAIKLESTDPQPVALRSMDLDFIKQGRF
jgi:hypothetical protein